ncbi:hypothetical protein BH20ACT24_BH20ACT24_02800 [soil metagenome]
MPVVLGVDVSLGRGLDVVLMEEHVVKESWSRLGPSGLADLLHRHRPDAVAIDAPPSAGLGLLRDEAERRRLPFPPPPGKHLGRRIAEYELSRRGIGSHQTHYHERALFSWMTAGFETYRVAASAGYPPYLGGTPRDRTALEVFPYASYVALAGCLSAGRRWRLGWRRSILDAGGVVGLPADAGIDLVDAAAAALTGERFLRGDGGFIGDPREGVIVLPVPALEDRYRRCPQPENAPAQARLRVARRLCECGCGGSVRRRFVPGHASKLRSRLLREARVGRAAEDQLRRLGWLRHLEKRGPPT